MTFHRNPLVGSRDIDVLVKTKHRFFKPEVDTKTHKNIYFWNQTIMLITDIHFVLKSELKYANFENFGPPF